jgi:hypothetical protein
VNARHALGLLLRASDTAAGLETDAGVLVDVVDQVEEDPYELITLLAVLTRLSVCTVNAMAGLKTLSDLDVDGFVRREMAIEYILNRVFDEYEGRSAQE